MSLPLIDGQANFGSMDGDPPAAYRYTESRLDKPAESLLTDIDQDTVEFVMNYPTSERSRSFSCRRAIPNNPRERRRRHAVGMATRIRRTTSARSYDSDAGADKSTRI